MRGFFVACLVPFLSPSEPAEGTRMLEALISSRIRRALFEHILSHPSERFYLRGLAKSLGLSVSPLRRELKRLEQSGVLQAAQEGNMLFYTVNTSAPAFIQLQQASQQDTKAPSPSEQLLRAPGSGLQPVKVVVAPSPQPPAPSRFKASWQAPRPAGALLGAAGMAVALIIVVASLLYVRVMSHEMASDAARVMNARKTQALHVPRQASSSRVMRGGRWQITPGGVGGGFSSGANSNSGALTR
jgi:hypothetical protein